MLKRRNTVAGDPSHEILGLFLSTHRVPYGLINEPKDQLKTTRVPASMLGFGRVLNF